MLNVEWKSSSPVVIQHSTFNIQHSTFAFLRVFIVCAFVTTTAFAQISSFGGGASNIPGQELVKLTGSVTERHATEVKGVVTATIQSGWHINSNKPLDDFVIPTKLSFDGTELVSAEYPQHTVRSFTFSGGQKLAVYEGTIQIPFTAKLQTGDTIKGKLHYQACNDTVCLPPRDAEVTIDANVVAPAPATSSSFTPLSAAPKGATPVGNDRLSAAYAEHGLPLTLLILFVGGLALNLTPCVFPMIPITVGFFAMQSDGRRSRRFALSLAYVLGIVITYSALGVFAALSGRMFGSWLQSPAVLIGFAVLMLVLASSMFGVWEFRVPQFITNRSAGRAGVAGALTMGLFVGIVAAPCVGPVVVALFTLVAAIAKPTIGMAMFATLAFGLGFPYLIALNVFPKPGEWMVQVKKAMGFVLIAMAFYFLRAVIGETPFRLGVAASLLIGAIFLFLSRGPRGRFMRLACAFILLAGGIAFAIPPRKGVEVQWQKYDAAVASTTGKPIVIDFFATWCIPCKELDEKTFSDASVAKDLDRFTRIKADLTNGDDPAVKELTKRYAIVGVPTVVFIDSSGHEQQQLRLTGFEKPEQFLARTQQVK
ncbi:MAG: thioredoxin:protein disulfide reductase [Thermoanaerobaculia bacterium]|jgi:thiol:disulfide interchange protein DsbD|nr:thioredoxin:protein disulfide reductase [Thermoanaerobaculia bacterium]